MRILLCVALFLAATVQAEKACYRNYKVYGVVATGPSQWNQLQYWENNEVYDFWTPIRKNGDYTDIMVKPDLEEEFLLVLNAIGLDYIVKIEDVEKLIEEEEASQKLARSNRVGLICFNQFHDFDYIEWYLKELVRKYPFVRLENYGKSYEGRNLTALRISRGGNGKNPVIFVDGGIHGREWISPSMALYIINQLVENKQHAAMSESIDWVIIPVANPDGYVFSQTSNRLWRKTRSSSPSSKCYGADANRNFDYHWAEIGSSISPCSDNYHGQKAFSEVESASLAEYASRDAHRIKFYLSFHSFGKYIVYPWGYTQALPGDYKRLRQVAEIGNAAINAVRGTSYTVGSTSEVLISAAGSSHDYMKGALGVELSFTMELPGGGFTGFDLPTSEIQPVVSETFEAIKAWHGYILNEKL